ncbi:MAG: hypothetical protein LAO07_03705 [Acidobacteriia bacterium]|nr:hypothetical protein [Terriglobia bacterium]
MRPRANRFAPGPATVPLLGLLLVLIYNANLRPIASLDTVPTRLLPFSLILRGNVYLDDWIQPYLGVKVEGFGVYFVRRAHGHWVSRYPILLPVLITPLYLVPAWWVSAQPPALSGQALTLVAETMEKLAASAIAALSVVVLYLALRKVSSAAHSLLVGLIYGLASNTWAISSQALWRQGMTELCFALLLWSLLRGPDARGSPFWAGLSVALAAANKPAYVIFAALLFIYFARHHRRGLWQFCAPLFVIGVLVLIYNISVLGKVFGGLPFPVSWPQEKYMTSHFQASTVGALTGLLLSPSRGLLIYSPWVVFSLWGAVRLWKAKALDWGRYILIGVVIVLILHARYTDWWGGHCFGPRYLTDLMPFLAFFLVLVVPQIQAAPILRAALVLALAAALWVQVVGAFHYPGGGWDTTPVNVDVRPDRLWDWTDTQLSRSWHAPAAAPEFCYRWGAYFSLRKALEGSGPGAQP